MSKGESGLFDGTMGSNNSKSNDAPKNFQGNRTREEYSDLARDPARGTKVDYKGQKERSIILDLEKQGKVGRVIRDKQAERGADFVDTSNKQKWDIKSFVSKPAGHTSPRKGAYSEERAIANIRKEISRGHKVVIDTRKMSEAHKQQLKKAVHENGYDDSVIWYDKKGE